MRQQSLTLFKDDGLEEPFCITYGHTLRSVYINTATGKKEPCKMTMTNEWSHNRCDLCGYDDFDDV